LARGGIRGAALAVEHGDLAEEITWAHEIQGQAAAVGGAGFDPDLPAPDPEQGAAGIAFLEQHLAHAQILGVAKARDSLQLVGAATAAVIVVLALLLIIGIPSGFLSSEIQARVERETGYRLTISGGTKIGLWPKLNVTLTDVTLENPKDPETSNRLTVGRVQ